MNFANKRAPHQFAQILFLRSFWLLFGCSLLLKTVVITVPEATSHHFAQGLFLNILADVIHILGEILRILAPKIGILAALAPKISHLARILRVIMGILALISKLVSKHLQFSNVYFNFWDIFIQNYYNLRIILLDLFGKTP